MDSQSLALAAHVPAAARGDRAAFAALVDATRSVVSSIALAIVRDVELSRDVAQDVFLLAWRDLKNLRDPNSFLPWLRQLTRHRAYHVLRTERRRSQHLAVDDADVLLGIAVDPRPDAGAQMLADEERRLLATVLDELPDEAREVVTLYYREGESTAHVAQLLGLSEASVRQRLSRARTRLRTTMLDRFGAAAARSAPDAAFTTAILMAVVVGAPAVSSAATLTVVSASAPSLLIKLAALGGGALLGAAAALAGVLHGTRRLKRQARTVEELWALKRFEFVSAAVVVLTAVLFPVSFQLTRQPWSQVATFAGFIIGLVGLQVFWLPRILRTRHEIEALEDPVRAARARAMERRGAILGWSLGITFGTAGLIAGLWMAAG